VNRSVVIEQFGLSVNQASTDLSRYIGFAPDNMVHDKSARMYVSGPDYSAHFLKPDASRYRAQLQSLADGIMNSDDIWISELPSYDAAPTPAHGVNPLTLRSVVGAIRRSEAIEVKYQPLSSPEPRWRWIAPHAIGFDGFRWHTRAFCLTDEAFKDFLLSRMLEIRGSQESSMSAEEDRDWKTKITLEIGPHPALSETQAKVIALHYGMRAGEAKIKVRRALLYYALRRLDLDTDPEARKPQDGPVAYLCRPNCSFKPLSVRRRPDFSSPMLSAVDADCRSP
jgi:predicted DNA-binding transcriptional regulator YafY